MRMKALASDFDNTLYFENIENNFKSGDLKTIQEFQSQGNLFGICTGRPFIGITCITEKLIDFDFYIISSGALILDKNLKVLFKKCIAEKTLRDIYKQYNTGDNFFIQESEKVYAFQHERNLDIPQIEVSSLEEVDMSDILSISINANTEVQAKKMCQEINDTYSEVECFQNKQYIDIVRKGCSKGSGIVKVKKLMNNITIAGIGDSYNDLPMLDVADISFTFTDSPNIVKEKADHLVSSIEEAIQIFNQ